MTEPVPDAAVVMRILPASPAEVYGEWLDAVGMAEWMCPRPARPTKIELDATIGGRLHIQIDDEGFELSITGRYLELDPPRRLAFTWSCSTWEPPGDSIVTVTLEPHGEAQTLMTIHHAQLPPAVVEGHRNGWARIGEQLEGWLTSNLRT